MNNSFFTIICLLIFSNTSNCQTLNVAWQKCIGGSGKEEKPVGLTRSDLSYTVGFSTISTNGDISGNKGDVDWFFSKYDKDQALVFGKIAGGSKTENFSSIHENSDKTYVAIGTTNSAAPGTTDGNVTNNHGGNDAWVTKLTANGSIQWRKCIGGIGEDQGNFTLETADNNYLLLGTTASADGDFTSNAGSNDIFLIKCDINGIFLFTKTFGGIGNDKAVGVTKLADGYMILAESASSTFPGATNSNKGKNDFLLIKTDLNGTVSWSKFFGGPDEDNPTHIMTLSDGNVLVTGTTSSTSGDITGAKGATDIWVAKISASGSLVWARNFGGTGNDLGKMAVEYASPNKYFIIGTTSSNNGNVSGNKGGSDIWIAQLTSSGTFESGKTFGGSQDDFAGSITTTTDKAILITGETLSNDGNVSGNHGGKDIWVAKLTQPTATFDLVNSFEMKLYPNPANSFVTVKWASNIKVETITITNIFGQNINEIKLDSESDFFNLNTSFLQSGNYIISLKAKEGITRSMLEVVK
ncbi:MAG: T9SS type A sorting domain-containing protein [Saprospiraceae bacterium]|nr:T9SS type A sorting domain-containing protein [Saprospiraceae bacterium]